jgi:mRNA interferase RelE/StbE
MSYEVLWETLALEAATRIMKDDPAGLRQVFASADLLADNPRPEGTAMYGSTDLRRMHSGRYRLLYEIRETHIQVAVLQLGRTA